MQDPMQDLLKHQDGICTGIFYPGPLSVREPKEDDFRFRNGWRAGKLMTNE